MKLSILTTLAIAAVALASPIPAQDPAPEPKTAKGVVAQGLGIWKRAPEPKTNKALAAQGLGIWKRAPEPETNKA